MEDTVFEESIDQESQGKIKKLFRRLEASFQGEIKKTLDHINSQIGSVSEKLDKKYGGMYKVLIHEFLTKQEEKIYNVELVSQATRNILSEHIYQTSEHNFDSREAFMEDFNLKFKNEMKTINDQVVAKVKEDLNVKKDSEEQTAGQSA